MEAHRVARAHGCTQLELSRSHWGQHTHWRTHAPQVFKTPPLYTKWRATLAHDLKQTEAKVIEGRTIQLSLLDVMLRATHFAILFSHTSGLCWTTCVTAVLSTASRFGGSLCCGLDVGCRCFSFIPELVVRFSPPMPKLKGYLKGRTQDSIAVDLVAR